MGKERDFSSYLHALAPVLDVRKKKEVSLDPLAFTKVIECVQVTRENILFLLVI